MKYSPLGPKELDMSASYEVVPLGKEVVSDLTGLICELDPVQRTIANLVTLSNDVDESESSVSSTHFTVTVAEPPEASKELPDFGVDMETSAATLATNATRRSHKDDKCMVANV